MAARALRQIFTRNMKCPHCRKRLGFFPHPAVGETAPDEPHAAAFEATRPIPILWPGGYTPPQRPWVKLSDLKARHQGEANWRENDLSDGRPIQPL